MVAFDASIWSHAAGSLLVAESGGLVTDTAGNLLDVSNPNPNPDPSPSPQPYLTLTLTLSHNHHP